MENLSTSELEGLANLPSVSFMLDMRLDKTDEKSIFSNLLSPISLMIASEQFKHWKPGLSQHTIFECTIDKGDNLQFVITFKIVYAPYQYNIIKEMAIARLSEVLSNISSWSHRIRDGAHMLLVVYSSDEIMITRNVNDNQAFSREMKTVTPFYDSYGNALLPGDKIIIELDCNYQHRNGLKAVLIWNERVGMYRFAYTIECNGKLFSGEDDFYGIMRFKKDIDQVFSRKSLARHLPYLAKITNRAILPNR